MVHVPEQESNQYQKPKKAKGAPEPVLLRSYEALLGLDNLSKTDRAKVEAANDVYRTATVQPYR